MLSILKHGTYRKLFAAQVVALLGTGVLTIALGLMAFDLSGDKAGQVLGLALTIKMLAYVGFSPILTALVARLDRRKVLIAADLVRAAAALCLLFIDAVWQIYILILLLQAASATFTPTFQAVIPDILPDEAEYTRALSLSRLAYDIENIVSPALAGLLLLILAPSALFAGTALGFALSAVLVLSCNLPKPTGSVPRLFLERLTLGSRIYLATPRLRGLLALNVTVAASGSVVIILSVVVARGLFDGSDRDLAILLGAYGFGSMVAALSLPQLLEHWQDRSVMLWAGRATAGLTFCAGLGCLIFGWPGWVATLCLWMFLGASIAAILTPSGRLLRRSATSEDRPSVFAAQFALSHACWLLAYPAAGFLGSYLGVAATMAAMGVAAILGVLSAQALWPPRTAQELGHEHSDLPADHPHLQGARRRGSAWVHSHTIVIDDEHTVWPTQG